MPKPAPIRTLAAIFAALLVGIATLTLAGTSAATPSQPFSGSSIVTSYTPTSDRDAGGNVIEEADATLVATGTFTGTFTGTVRSVNHADGTAVQHSNYTATGTTPCGSGAFDIVVNGPFNSSGIQTGHFTTIDNSTNTAGIHADVDFVFDASTGVATFTGTYHCI